MEGVASNGHSYSDHSGGKAVTIDVSDVLRVLKGITARRVIDYLKEKNYSTSLAKLQHDERDRNYRYLLWQTEKNVFPIFSEGMFMQKVN